MKSACAIWLAIILISSSAFLAIEVSEDIEGKVVENNSVDYVPRTPIRINGNGDFAAVASSGNGGPLFPWIIEGWDINGSAIGTCIFIGNTTDYFEIRDNHLHHANGLDSWPYFRDCGIHLYYVTNGTVINNDVHSNYWDGTLLFRSDYNNVSGNTFYYSNSGVYNEGSNFNTFYDNTIHHNQKGIYLIEEGFDPSNDNNVIKNTLENNGVSIRTWYSNNTSILNNNITWNDGWIIGDGINIDSSTNTTIAFNNITNSEAEAITMTVSEDNIIEDNILLNNRLGIYVYFSENATIKNNTMIGGGIYFLAAWDLKDYNTHIIEPSNTVNGKPIYYYKNLNGFSAPADAGQVILANCSNVSVSNFLFTNVFVGVQPCYSENVNITNVTSMGNVKGIYSSYLFNSSVNNCNLSGNEEDGLGLLRSNKTVVSSNKIVSNGRYGLSLGVSHNNSIFNNNISNNGNRGMNCYGVDKYNNYIFHNNFIGNVNWSKDRGVNFWNKSLPIGGNYWSDYSGIDGNSDGFGDTPYTNFDGEGNAQDNWPLMEPIRFEITNHNVPLSEGWNLISLPFEQSDESIEQALHSIDGKWNYIQTFDTISGAWQSNATFKPNQLNDFDSLNHKIGFWINITEPNVNLTVSGYILPFTSISLYAGWNLVGYPSLTNETVGNVLFGTTADKVMVCDTSKPYHIKEVGSTYLMQPGEGYWVHVVADSTWIVS